MCGAPHQHVEGGPWFARPRPPSPVKVWPNASRPRSGRQRGDRRCRSRSPLQGICLPDEAAVFDNGSKTKASADDWAPAFSRRDALLDKAAAFARRILSPWPFRLARPPNLQCVPTGSFQILRYLIQWSTAYPTYPSKQLGVESLYHTAQYFRLW